MDLDWTLIEYRPGRYAKVSKTGKFLGTATEAEVRAWFASSTRATGDEAPKSDPGSSAPPPTPEGSLPGFLEAVDASPEPEVPWDQPLIWAPTRPAPKPEADEPASETPAPRSDTAAPEPATGEGGESQPDTDESWAKPMLWAPTRPAPKPDAESTTSKEPGATIPQPGARLSARMHLDEDNEESSWAKPMLWGRPPARKSHEEASPSTIEPEAGVLGKGSLEAGEPVADPETRAPNVERVAAVEPEPADSPEPHPAPDIPDSTAAEDSRPGRDKAEAKPEAVPDASPADGPDAASQPGEAVEPDEVSESSAVEAPPAPGAPEPASADRGLEARPALVQVAMDLNGLESIAPSTPEPEPEQEPEPETAGEITLLEAMLPRGPAAAPEPTAEAADVEPATSVAEIGELDSEEPGLETGSLVEGPEPPSPEPDRAEPVPETGPAVEEPATPAPEPAPPDVEVAQAEPGDPDEHESVLLEAAEVPEPEEEHGVPAAEVPESVPDAGSDWQDAEFLEAEADDAALATDDDEDDLELEVFAPPPTTTRRPAAAAAPGPEPDATDPAAGEPEPDPAAAEDLWLWVDPRYEGGYSPATFDLSAFLQRAIALFQSKPWSGGHRPGRIAVHADEATGDLESVAGRLELTVIEDPRVSNGTYWLGLGSDGQPGESQAS